MDAFEYTALPARVIFGFGALPRAVDELAARGVQMEKYEGTEQDERGVMRGLSSGEGPDIAWFRDSAGNVLSVLQAE